MWKAGSDNFIISILVTTAVTCFTVVVSESRVCVITTKVNHLIQMTCIGAYCSLGLVILKCVPNIGFEGHHCSVYCEITA